MGNSLDNAMKIMDANDPDDPYSGSRYSDEELEQAVNQLHETPVIQATIKKAKPRLITPGSAHVATAAAAAVAGHGNPHDPNHNNQACPHLFMKLDCPEQATAQHHP